MAAYLQQKRLQKFRYLVVLDFEATCDEPCNMNPQEVIEWPAMIIDTQNECILPQYFHFYVKPSIHPKITQFCTNLTGITQSMVNNGTHIVDVARAWNHFCYKNNLLPNDSHQPEACIVTCGNWDLKTLWLMQSNILQQNTITDQLFNDVLINWSRCYLQQSIASSILNTIKIYYSEDSLMNPALFHSWVNIKQIVKQTYNRRAGGMMGILRELGIKHVGKHHSGIDDVRNICNIVLHVLRDGIMFDYTFVNWKGNGIWNDIEIKQNMQITKYCKIESHIRHDSQDKMITIRLETAHRNRIVTVVGGLSKFDIKQKKILKKLKKQFGTGGSVRKSKYVGKEILIQGDRRNDIKQFIQQKFHIDDEFIALQE